MCQQNQNLTVFLETCISFFVFFGSRKKSSILEKKHKKETKNYLVNLCLIDFQKSHSTGPRVQHLRVLPDAVWSSSARKKGW